MRTVILLSGIAIASAIEPNIGMTNPETIHFAASLYGVILFAVMFMDIIEFIKRNDR